LREQDVPRAIEALVASGFRSVQPPEDWLTKVYDEDRMVDLIYRPMDRTVTDAMLAEAVVCHVGGMRLPVLSATELTVLKLLTFSEHFCDFSRALPMARSLREQIDWERVRRDTAESPFAKAFLCLLGLLGVVAPNVADPVMEAA